MGGDQQNAAAHEAGHAIAAVAFGRTVRALRIGDYPLCVSIRADGAKTPRLGRLVELISGSTCEGIEGRRMFLMSEGTMRQKLAQVRDDDRGSCDRCQEAALLVAAFAGAADDDLVTLWSDAAFLAFLLFRHPTFRASARALSVMLRRRKVLFGDDVAALIDGRALFMAREDVVRNFPLGRLETLL
ncbi:hypothetical protein Ms3S1_10320 [Methylosinus sp. 3S-1]|uniref:Peptidase M41 domain-containing protein n=2 Tax=Methylocystaceae TaxID=31993 RepID=A0A2D2CXE3_METT3|nr:hypothetical protein CQW49_05200 [Methylosinus trichosporium OB3b]OBS51630.1 hypothetical protein A8B73_15580 [Methylosinus sp. 3S-1]